MWINKNKGGLIMPENKTIPDLKNLLTSEQAKAIINILSNCRSNIGIDEICQFCDYEVCRPECKIVLLEKLGIIKEEYG
jgi:hypothetical protein